MTIYTYKIRVQSTTSSGNKYFIDKNDGSGYQQNPPLTLLTTNEYRFEVDGNTMAIHPLHVSTSQSESDKLMNQDTSDIKISGSGANTNGHILSVTIPSGSSHTGQNLHYICGNHQGMGNLMSMVQVCFSKDMKVHTINGEKNIQDLERGDLIRTRNSHVKLNKLVITKQGGQTQFVRFEPNSISENVPNRVLYVIPTHPIYHNDAFIESKNLINNDTITMVYKDEDYIYNIQFETEESIYVNNTEFVSHHPNHFIKPLEKELYFNKKLFNKKLYGKYNSPESFM